MIRINKFIGNILKSFFQGVIFLVPLSITAWVIYYCYDLVRKYSFTDHPWLSLLIFLIGLILVGWLTSTLIARPLVKLFESLLTRAPFIKIIYTSIKDMLEAFMGEKKRFTRPVLITLDRTEKLQRIGFITTSDLSDLGLLNSVAVYVPMSYSLSGNLYIVQADLVVPLLDVDSTEIMKFIIAGGVTDIKQDDDEEPSVSVKRLLKKKPVSSTEEKENPGNDVKK